MQFFNCLVVSLYNEELQKASMIEGFEGNVVELVLKVISTVRKVKINPANVSKTVVVSEA